MKRIVYIIMALMVFSFGEAMAQTLTVDGPRQTRVGQNFQV